MDSGETIAQWRKFYFQKCRVRCVKHLVVASFHIQAYVHDGLHVHAQRFSVWVYICFVCVTSQTNHLNHVLTIL